MTIKKALFVVSAFMCFASMTGIATADSLLDTQFVSIAQDFATATIKKADGSLQTIQVGDVVADGYTVKQIAAGRIELEADTAGGPRPLVIRVEDGRQWIEPPRKNR
jgi:hypothetical protein